MISLWRSPPCRIRGVQDALFQRRSDRAVGEFSFSRRAVHCASGSLWLVETVQDPSRALVSVAAAGACCCAVWVALKLIIWDYQERKSDDAHRPYDIQSDVQLGVLSSGTLRHEAMSAFIPSLADYTADSTLLLAKEELKLLGNDLSAFPGFFYHCDFKSDVRRWCATLLGLAITTSRGFERRQPKIAFLLLKMSAQIVEEPPRADWGKPLAELFLFDEALEGIAVEKLLPHLNEDVRAQLHDVGTQVLPALKRLTEDTSGRD